MRTGHIRRTALMAAGLLLLAATAWASAPALTIDPPAALTVSADNPVTFKVLSPRDGSDTATFVIRTEDGLLTLPVFESRISLHAGLNTFAFSIHPDQLATLALGETVSLEGRVGTAATATDVTLAAQSGIAEQGGWVLNVPATAVIYSTEDSQLTYRIMNPKNKAYSATLLLKFKNLKGNVVAKWKYPTYIGPGEALHDVTIPVAVCLKAKLKGAASIKTSLKIGGDSKASGMSLLDWDLRVSTSANRTSGPAPLPVTFTTLVAGGATPYSYVWDFGDGSAHSSDQNPTHVYTDAGVYTAQLLVVDGRGGTVSAAPMVIAVQ